MLRIILSRNGANDTEGVRMSEKHIKLKYMEKGFAESIDHDMPNRGEFNKLVVRILELERRVEELEECAWWNNG